MRTEDATPRPDQTIRLADYQRPDWLISETRLIFDLHPTATHVRAALTFLRNPARADEGPADLRLDGHSMNLLAAAIDGAIYKDTSEALAETVCSDLATDDVILVKGSAGSRTSHIADALLKAFPPAPTGEA